MAIHDPVLTVRIARKSVAPMPCVPIATPSWKTASGRLNESAETPARHDQLNARALQVRWGSGWSAQVVVNG